MSPWPVQDSDAATHDLPPRPAASLCGWLLTSAFRVDVVLQETMQHFCSAIPFEILVSCCRQEDANNLHVVQPHLAGYDLEEENLLWGRVGVGPHEFDQVPQILFFAFPRLGHFFLNMAPATFKRFP